MGTEYKTLITRDIKSVIGIDDRLNNLPREGWRIHTSHYVELGSMRRSLILLLERVTK